MHDMCIIACRNLWNNFICTDFLVILGYGLRSNLVALASHFSDHVV